MLRIFGQVGSNENVHAKYSEKNSRGGMNLAEYNRWLETPATPKTLEPSDPRNNNPVYQPVSLREVHVPKIPVERIEFLYRSKLPRYTSGTVYWGINRDREILWYNSRKEALEAGLKEDALHFAVNNVSQYKGYIWVKAPKGMTLDHVNKEQVERAYLLAKQLKERA